MSDTYCVTMAITSYAYADIDADSPEEAMELACAEWKSYLADAQNHELTGIGWQDVAVTHMEPVA